MQSKTETVVERVTRDWLECKLWLFRPILDQLATEMAPIVAEQAMADLRERLYGKPTRDELLDQVEALLLDLQRWHETDQYDEGLKLEDAEHSLCSRIRHALNQLYHHRTAQRAKALAEANVELPAGDVVEGGGA